MIASEIKHSYDTIVIGAGAMGAATAYHLARDGRRVLLLEQFDLGHTRGSSHGESRIFRFAYTDANYARLAMQCKPMWHALEQEAGVRLFTPIGGIDIGHDAQGLADVDRVAAALGSLNAPFEMLNAAQTMARFPQWCLPENARAVYSPDTGSLAATLCVTTMALRAASHGAHVHTREAVTAIHPEGSQVRVSTGQGEYRAKSIVIAAGAWVNKLLAQTGFSLPVKIEKEHVMYFRPRDPARFAPPRFTVWIHYGARNVYGFPVLGEPGVKMGFHHEQHFVNVDDYDQRPLPETLDAYRTYMRSHLPDAAQGDFGALTCLYTTTPDENFVIDKHPALPNVIIGSPCSGHGFKFAIGVGRALADLATHGATEMQVEHCGLYS
jgi:sarcosine oxidase